MDARIDTRPERDPAVVVEGLTKRFGDRTVVDGISFTVPTGSVTGLIGPNGAGKTTIMGMLLGLVRPSAGSATVLGSPVEQRSQYLPRVGSLIEGPAFHPAVSGADNLRALAVLAGQRVSDAEIAHLIDLVGLTGRGDDRFGAYSLGMKQRLGIAAALLGDPELVILDEPTNGLDPVGMQEVRELIGRIGQSGTTVIVSSHLLAELEAVCDWLIVVDRGGLVHAGPAIALGSSDHALVMSAAPDDLDRLARLVERYGYELAASGPDHLRVVVPGDCQARDLARDLNAAAHAEGIVLHELRSDHADLEARYLQLVQLSSGGS